MPGEIANAYETTRERGEQAGVSMEVLAAWVANEFQVDGEELATGLNNQMETSAELVVHRLQDQCPAISRHDLGIAADIARGLAGSTMLKSFAAGLELMRERTFRDV